MTGHTTLAAAKCSAAQLQRRRGMRRGADQTTEVRTKTDRGQHSRAVTAAASSQWRLQRDGGRPLKARSGGFPGRC